MPADGGAAIADRALALVGTPFRLHGRSPEGGLDCVGVVAWSLEGTSRSFAVPCDYRMRGDYLGRVSAFFGRDCFSSIAQERALPGDILLCRPAYRQLHFAVVTVQGAVHAHAGLRRIVLTPPPFPWLVIGHWRFIGD